MSSSLVDATKEFQKELRSFGYDPGEIDGVWGTLTAGAALKFIRGNAPSAPAIGEEFDQRTEKNLATLEHGARAKFVPFLRHAFSVAASMGVEAKVICGRRGEREQEDAKRRGASKAGWGYSWHNFGMAVDLGLFKGGRYVDSANPSLASSVYAAMGALAPRFGLEWGGGWKSFKDPPHFHVAVGRVTPSAADRRLLFSGQWSF